LRLDAPKTVRATVRAAALLDEDPENPEKKAIRERPLNQQPYWHVERARIGATRRVPVEVVVNGYPRGAVEIEADGSLQDVRFDVPIEQSSWIAVRIFPSSHTNPVFVEVAGRPVRASRRSAEWCIKAVDQCWKSKKGQIRQKERPEAEAAYDQAREAYQRILEESSAD